MSQQQETERRKAKWTELVGLAREAVAEIGSLAKRNNIKNYMWIPARGCVIKKFSVRIYLDVSGRQAKTPRYVGLSLSDAAKRANRAYEGYPDLSRIKNEDFRAAAIEVLKEALLKKHGNRITNMG